MQITNKVVVRVQNHPSQSQNMRLLACQFATLRAAADRLRTDIHGVISPKDKSDD